MLSTGFIGGGRITRILVGGWARAGALPPRVLVHDTNPEAIAAVRAVAPTIEHAPAASVAQADVVFVALHPPAIVGALAEMRPFLSREVMLVSLAPKIPIAALRQSAGTARIARMIPNAASLVGRGFNPIAYGPGLDHGARARLATLFASWGEAPSVPEEHLEAYAVLTGMGPTYFWFQWQALRELAYQMGLSGTDTDAALRSMVHGALATLLDAGLPPAAVMDLVPVRPLLQLEPAVTEAYQRVLPSLHAKIRSVESVVV